MKIGEIVVGKVTGIQPYGAFVSLDENTTGLIHISEISDGFVRDVHQFVRIGEEVRVKIIDIDTEHQQVRLSLKAVNNSRKHRSRQNVGKPLKPKIGFQTIEDMYDSWLQEALKKGNTEE